MTGKEFLENEALSQDCWIMLLWSSKVWAAAVCICVLVWTGSRRRGQNPTCLDWRKGGRSHKGRKRNLRNKRIAKQSYQTLSQTRNFIFSSRACYYIINILKYMFLLNDSIDDKTKPSETKNCCCWVPHCCSKGLCVKKKDKHLDFNKSL